MAKAYEELEISDDFMYGKVTEDLEITRKILEMATGRKIENLHLAENQKTIIATMDGKDVRLDSYVEDDENIMYDSEMHNRSSEDKKDDPQLPKRSRYYQGMIDIHILQSGARYQDLKQSYVIFFCTFDPFGNGLKRYTFENICIEDSSIKLGDKTTKIFFNTKGNTEENLSEAQKSFMNYVETGEVTDELTQRIDTRVREVRKSEIWRSQYMKTLLHDQDMYYSGVDAGIEQGIVQGIEQGIEQQRLEDEKIIADKDAEIAKLREIIKVLKEDK